MDVLLLSVFDLILFMVFLSFVFSNLFFHLLAFCVFCFYFTTLFVDLTIDIVGASVQLNIFYQNKK